MICILHVAMATAVPMDYTLPIKQGIGHFQSIKNGVLLIFSFITGDKTEFLSPIMFSNKYITGI